MLSLIVFLHVTAGSWTKSVLMHQVTEVRGLEGENFTSDDMEEAVVGAIVARANKIQSPIIPGALMLFGSFLILASNRSKLVNKE